jgi:uncharacterized protein
MSMRPLDLPREELAQFCRRNRIRRLAVFGSALRDDFAPESDLDLLVEFQPDTKVGLRFFAIERELTEIIGRRVDLNTPGFISPHFRDEVMREAQTVYESA